MWRIVGAIAGVVVLAVAGLALRFALQARERAVTADTVRRKRIAPEPARLDVRQRGGVDSVASPVTAFPMVAAVGETAGDPVSVARATAAEYRQRARYPRWSQPITSGEDPLLADQRPLPVTGDGGAPQLTAYSAHPNVVSPDPVILVAYLSSGDARVAARSMRAAIVDDQDRTIGDVVYNDDGRAGDSSAGDQIFTARFGPSDGLPDVTAAYTVRVYAQSTQHEERAVTTSFTYSRPDAELTGSYRDARDGGDLNVDAEVAVAAPGRFHIEATLFTTDGVQPIAWAQHTNELPAGTHWLRLRFYGLALRERGVDGPYLVRSVALSTMTQLPVAKNRVAERVHVTSTYAADSFSDKPFDDPDLLEAADRIEQAIEGLSPDAGG